MHVVRQYRRCCWYVAPRIAKVPTWIVYVFGVGWAIWLFWLALSGKLGVNPTEILLHSYGKKALQLLLVILAMRPLQIVCAPIAFVRFRRACGVLCFIFMLLHFFVWAVLDVQILEHIVEDIQKRPYIAVGFAAFVLSIPLAITSNNFSVRRLGILWLRLHRLTYVVVLLAGLHFMWLVKGEQAEPLVYMAGICILLAWRVRKRLTKKRPK